MKPRDSRKGRGGRPGRLVGSYTRPRRERELEIPVNVERALLRAAEDAGFRELLLGDRARALDELPLTGSERALLRAMPAHLLERLLDRLDPQRLRNRFAAGVAAAVAGTMIFAASCDTSSQPKGAGPDLPDDTDTETESDEDAGPDGGE